MAGFSIGLGLLILDASEHDALPVFSATMMLFIIPLTIVTLMVIAARALRAGGKASPVTTDQNRKH